MKSAILTVGTEILFGQITNTNSVYLSQQLNMLGIDVMYHYTVGDNPNRLKQLIHHAFQECDLILTTGGLGPTQDDLTKEIAAEAFNDHLVLHEPTLEFIENYFKKLGRVMTENNKKQAYIPSKATILTNDAGTAPGFVLEENGKIIICMPGPPREMLRMFETGVKPYLQKKSDSVIFYKMLRTFGIGESALEDAVQDFIDAQTDPTLATYAKEGEACLRIASKRASLEEAKEAVDEMILKVKERVGEYIFSYDDESLGHTVGKKLMDKKLTMSSAESCTGGLFASTMTDIPGISAVFDRGFVTYSNEAKMAELGVKQETLEKYGAVSQETAVEMAKGVKAKTGSRVCISVTGIAGPDGGTEEKPVGLVYICVIFDDKVEVKECRMRNVSRQWNRNYSVLYMLDMINKVISTEVPNQ